MAIVGFLTCTELLALLSSVPWGAGHPRGPHSSCPGRDPRACGSTPVHARLCTTTLTAILCVLQAQPWESLGTSKLLKACDDCTAPEKWPAVTDRQSWHASMLPARAPPRALFLGTGSRTLWANLPLFPTAQPCKGGWLPEHAAVLHIAPC